ncbi:MAG: YbjQ family protein [Bacteroidota bacterium]
MTNLKDILVTTTPNIEGVNIKRYIKPISAHVVAGTNFFSDLFASFSDVFGGRSQTYQRQLSSIYYEAIEILKRSAYELGANGILSLRVDLDEISGKGKSMFMITATGTAVIFDEINKITSKTLTQEKVGVMSHEKMIELRKRKEIIQLVADSKLVLDDATFEFITSNSVHEISNEVLEKICSAYVSSLISPEAKNQMFELLINYLLSLSEEHTINLLYTSLMSDKYADFTQLLLKLIKKLMIFDAIRLEHYLKDEDTNKKAKALQLVSIDKPFYVAEDIIMYEKLIKLIETEFKKTGELILEKSFLSSKEKEIWQCKCGTKNGMDYVYCNKCHKDIYSFSEYQINPEKAIQNLKLNLEIIKNNVQ